MCVLFVVCGFEGEFLLMCLNVWLKCVFSNKVIYFSWEVNVPVFWLEYLREIALAQQMQMEKHRAGGTFYKCNYAQNDGILWVLHSTFE